MRILDNSRLGTPRKHHQGLLSLSSGHSFGPRERRAPPSEAQLVESVRFSRITIGRA